MHETEQMLILVIAASSCCLAEIQLEVDEEVLVLHLAEVEQAQIVLLLLIDLHVAVVPHNSLVQTTGRQSICRDQVKHVFVLEFAHSRLLIAENVCIPRLIEKELFDA